MDLKGRKSGGGAGGAQSTPSFFLVLYIGEDQSPKGIPEAKRSALVDTDDEDTEDEDESANERDQEDGDR